MAYTSVLSYEMVQGLPWERLIIVKNRRTRRLVRPSSAQAFVKTGATTTAPLSVSLTKEGILLCMTATETEAMPVGVWDFDVVATVNGVSQPVAKGKIAVEALNTVTPLEEDESMEIRFIHKQNVDFRRKFIWRDSAGVPVSIQSAYMQAKNDTNQVVIDLRWFASVPSESTIVALPGAQRGYLAPATGYTLEMHISNANTVPAGTYPFDLFVQETSGDWDCIAQGTIVVEASVSAPPV